jgi:hypothetical protein
MTIKAFEGPAGCGKTYQLMQELQLTLSQVPLTPGQQVLAITFMHGARRRLEARLNAVVRNSNRFRCITLDSLAVAICQRWRSLGRHLRLPASDGQRFEEICNSAGILLEQPPVAKWIRASYPIVVVDEAQDLHPERLRVVRALAETTYVLVAADEFQCLNSELRPNPAVEWIRASCNVTTLAVPHRTNVAALLEAASDIRQGNPPRAVSCFGFDIKAAPGVPLAGTFLANAVRWNGRGSVSAITPSRRSRWVLDTVEYVTKTKTRHGSGPYRFVWEHTHHDETEAVLEKLALPDVCRYSEALSSLEVTQGDSVKDLIGWLKHRHRVTGQQIFSTSELRNAVDALRSRQRKYSGTSFWPTAAMTVHHAKNREFDGVVVLWPYTVAGDAEDKRRLLYNAVTRARRWCMVLVQNEKLLAAPPFSAEA